MTSNEWTEYKIGDICEVLSSKRIFASDYVKSGIPFYRSKEIIQKALGEEISDILYIDLNKYNEIKQKFGSPQSDDILISAVGERSGIPYLVRDEEFYFKDGNLIWLRNFNNLIVYSSFLCYWLKSISGQKSLENLMIGSAQKALTIIGIKGITINLPPLETQQKIAKVLSAIDDKIELNNSINNNLEQQAQAIFKSWFVDFEPFGGTMPNNWKKTTLGKVTENIRTKVGNNAYTVLSAVNIGKLQPSDEYFSKQVYSKDTQKYIKVEEGNFAYNPARINIGSIGINDLGYTGCVSPVYVAFSVNKHYENFFRFFFKSKVFKEETKTRASGSVRQSLNYSDFAMIELLYPSEEFAKKFNDLYNSYFDTMKKINAENQLLMTLRDTLLPKLMSGEIDVSNIDISTDKLSI